VIPAVYAAVKGASLHLPRFAPSFQER